MIVTGVRWAESVSRAKNHGLVKFQGKPKGTRKIADDIGVSYTTPNKDSTVLMDDNDESRRLVEQCYRTRKTTLNPIVDWTDDDVWHYLNNVAKVPHCDLYEKGFHRLGCVGCPLAGKAKKEFDFALFPKYKTLFLRAFDKMLKNRGESKHGENAWQTAQEVFDWWINI